MKRSFKKATHGILAVALSLGIMAPVIKGEAAPVKAADNNVPIQILGINDFHGALETTSKDPSGAAIGGADYLSANLDLAESQFTTATGASASNSIRVQAGDMVGASPAVSGLLQDEPTIKALDQMNFKIGTLGNHEFDEGLPEYKRILNGESTDKFGPIVENYPHKKSNMKIVAANVVNKGTDQVAEGFSPYVVEEIGGVKVGFIGIVTTEIPNLVLANYIKDYDFLDEAETVAKYSKVLRDQGVNAIVVLSHVPALSSGNPTIDTTKTDVAGEAANMMIKVNQIDPDNSVDLVLAGHNHQYTNGVVGTTRIVQSYNNGKAFSNVTGELDLTTGDFVKTPDATITYNYRTGTPDAAVTAITTDAKQRIESLSNEPIGYTDQTVISRDTNPEGKAIDDKESALGNLITDAQRYMANKAGMNVDFAMTNNGGIRSDLITTPINGKNTITWGSAQAVQPFGNILQVVEMSGADILEALNQQYQSNQTYFLQISGLKYSFTDTDDADLAYQVANVTTEDGQALDPAKTYRVVINDFLFGGGDGFSAFKKANLVGAIDPDTETFISYIKDQASQNKAIHAEKEGRKTYKTAEELAAEKEQAAIKAIQDATKINPIKEGEKVLTGTTIPNATVSVSKKADTSAKMLRAAANPEATSDANGQFSVDISSLGLVKGDELQITVTDAEGYSATFAATVAAPAEEQPGTDDGENGNENPAAPDKDNNGSNGNGLETTENTKVTDQKADSQKQDLPKTGDQSDFPLVAGGVALSAAAYLILRRKA
ncbi:5'-nucleotidase C-terminal domain-containing protein [Listeria costaricensis]|uniref:5'-nucleotidase C-terminal domain-containing protein n=1 Tax=Listeria costaricensis TaxID=2026604 RepID=UPI003B845E7A